MIPYGRQDINEADIQAVIEVLKSDFITQGPLVSRFEQAVAEYCNAQYGVATSNATSALHLACLALDLGPGDRLWTSPNTFVASANCGRYCGAEVDFVDIDPVTYNLGIPALEEKLQQAEKQNRLPKVLIPVHFAGQSCDMRAIARLAEQYRFHVIEDASHAIGGDYHDQRIGSCQYSDIVVFSFHPVKMITTGEGGMAVTNQKTLQDRMIRLRSHGVSRDATEMAGSSHGNWFYQQLELGYNYRMSDIQAALGLSQLARLPEFVTKRRELATRYEKLLNGLPLITPSVNPDTRSAWHLYVVRVKPEADKSRKQLYDALHARGIGVQVHYIPVHTQPYYQDQGFSGKVFPQTEDYYSETLTLPLYPGMNHESQDYVVQCIRDVLT